MRTLFIATALLGLTAAAPGHAEGLGRPCTDKSESAYLSLDALKGKLAEQGYEVRKGNIKNACGEFYVIDKAGKRAEVFLDPTSGAIVSGGAETAENEAKEPKK